MLGFKPCIIEKRHQLGGLQNDSPYLNEWIAAVSGLTGKEVALTIHNNILSHGIRCFFESEVIHVECTQTGFRVEFVDKEKVHHLVDSSFLVIATGVSPATGDLQETDRLLIGPGNKISNHDFTNKSVAILGGGDSAFENYEFIKAKQPSYVHIYARNDKEHSIRARQEFTDRVPAVDVRQYEGACHIDTVSNTVNGEKYDRIIVLYGWTASIPFMAKFNVEKTAKGFVATNGATYETSEAGIYAIGEVAQRVHPCCVTAMADGVVAAKAIQKKLELRNKK
ncbi:unnamed protein product [Rotaria sp. Silwood2]|nr:unnamed protein product [Rotaria sp. Silwood2]CAF2970256.1 unnamed protein product [Rotaria sp. Silwood2]CAF3319287.1 unnamed protein product [Rotaria sp. Silwood2]